MVRLAILALVSAAVLGCGGATAEPVLCEVAHQLTIAADITEQAVAKDVAGDVAGAQQLAFEAKSRADQAHDRLQSITGNETRHGATWQALLQAYLGVGQAANMLLPGSEGGREMAVEELAAARSPLQAAAAGLPASCITVSASAGAAGG